MAMTSHDLCGSDEWAMKGFKTSTAGTLLTRFDSTAVIADPRGLGIGAAWIGIITIVYRAAIALRRRARTVMSPACLAHGFDLSSSFPHAHTFERGNPLEAGRFARKMRRDAGYGGGGFRQTAETTA
jgi:hypothetical protein